MVIVVDTSVFVNWMRGTRTRTVRQLHQLLADDHPVHFTDVIYAELLSGNLTSQEQRAIERFRDIGRVMSNVGLDDFTLAADCYRAARARGRTVRSLSDCLVAAVCIRSGATLLHDDRDFVTLASCTKLQTITPG
jgi:predicted nucleic acid-binding protein